MVVDANADEDEVVATSIKDGDGESVLDCIVVVVAVTGEYTCTSTLCVMEKDVVVGADNVKDDVVATTIEENSGESAIDCNVVIVVGEVEESCVSMRCLTEKDVVLVRLSGTIFEAV